MPPERLDPTCGGPVGALTTADVCAARTYLLRLRAARGRPDRYAVDERAAAAPPGPLERAHCMDPERAAERVLGATRNRNRKQDMGTAPPLGDHYGGTSHDHSSDNGDIQQPNSGYFGDSDFIDSDFPGVSTQEPEKRRHWGGACTGTETTRQAGRRHKLLKHPSRSRRINTVNDEKNGPLSPRRRLAQTNVLARLFASSTVAESADDSQNKSDKPKKQKSQNTNSVFSSVSSATSSETEPEVASVVGRESLLTQHQQNASWRLADDCDYDQSPAATHAADQAVAVVEKIALRMSDYDAPFYDIDSAKRSSEEELKEKLLRRRRAAHRLLLGVLSFDGSRGLVAAGDSGYNADADTVLDAWYAADDDLSSACAEYRRHVKALSMLQAVCTGLLDILRAVDRIYAAVKKESSLIGGRLKTSSASSRARPNRFWTDAREKSAQISVVVCRLYKYNSSLPIVSLVRDVHPGQPGSLKQASRQLHVPMPTDGTAPEVLDSIRAALLEAREAALESLSQVVSVVWDAGLRTVEIRHAKIQADIALIDNRFDLVENVFRTAGQDRTSLRIVYEITQIIKAQLGDAGIA